MNKKDNMQKIHFKYILFHFYHYDKVRMFLKSMIFALIYLSVGVSAMHLYSSVTEGTRTKEN